jgi:DNA-binding CsgD family transcriptional regulator
MVARAGVELEHAPRHLALLYDTGKLLARFESVQKTVPAVISRATDALQLSTTILIEGGEKRVRTFVWHAPGVTRLELRRAQRLARRSFAYLAGPACSGQWLAPRGPESDEGTIATALETLRPCEDRSPQSRVTLPLVVDRRPVFGVLHVKCHRSLDDVDLACLTAVTNQIAVAVERETPVSPAAEEAWVRPALVRLKEQFGLTMTELTVSEYAVRGLSNKEIGLALGTATATIRTHLFSVYRKMGIASRGQLSYRACCESHR